MEGARDSGVATKQKLGRGESRKITELTNARTPLMETKNLRILGTGEKRTSGNEPGAFIGTSSGYISAPCRSCATQRGRRRSERLPCALFVVCIVLS